MGTGFVGLGLAKQGVFREEKQNNLEHFAPVRNGRMRAGEMFGTCRGATEDASG